MFYYYALYSGWTKAPTLEPEKCVRLAGELFRDLSVPVSMVLPELVAHRPRMKWTDEHCLIMVQLFFHGFCLPDGARVLEQYWWLAELCRWIEECMEDGAAFSDEIQDALAETLVIASFRLPDAKSRRLMKRAVSLLEEGHYFDTYSQGKELRALVEENIDIAAVAEDARFSAEFRKAVYSIRDNGDAQVTIFRELDKSEALHQILRNEYPALCTDYDALVAQANEAADAAFSKAALEDDIFAALQQEPRPQPVIRAYRKIGRNEPCPCGSGKKFKNCCMGKGIYD